GRRAKGTRHPQAGEGLGSLRDRSDGRRVERTRGPQATQGSNPLVDQSNGHRGEGTSEGVTKPRDLLLTNGAGGSAPSPRLPPHSDGTSSRQQPRSKYSFCPAPSSC